MTNKKFVLNADDFGMSEAYNRAVAEGYSEGILKSASLVSNGDAFEEAVTKIIPASPDLGIGIHLNIIEGKSLTGDVNLLTDVNNNFKNSFLQLLIKSYNPKDKAFLEQVEREFRAQIEKVKSRGIEISHIDSHVHTHSIPPIFEIVCKLAKEYGIHQVRTQFEYPYVIPDVFIHLNRKYLVNIIKIVLLEIFTLINRKTVKKYELNTNDYLIGVGYTGMMSALSVSYGLIALKNKSNIIVEALIHPCRYQDGTIDGHFTEFQITKNLKLKEKIEQLGFEIGNYK
ncbi:ChbG/HpnK family deacetylase [bacterium]|nr:ChbG/HpnK family deacetylase [bacterium]